LGLARGFNFNDLWTAQDIEPADQNEMFLMLLFAPDQRQP
jgi:hypothetical protein